MDQFTIQISREKLDEMIQSEFYQSLLEIDRTVESIKHLLLKHRSTPTDLRIINGIVDTLGTYESAMNSNFSSINVPPYWMSYLPYFDKSYGDQFEN